jgi:hypothetical protein
MSVYIPALGAIAVAVFTAIWGAIIYPRQKAVDRQNYADQKAIDREEYAAQKKTDREIELRNRRMKEYEGYLTAFRKDARLYDYGRTPAEDSKEKIETVNEYWLAYGTLFQLAPDPVLLAVAEFHKFAWLREPYVESDEAYDRRFKTLYAAMIIEMRKDAFEETRLPQELVEELLPFYFSQASEPASDEGEESPRSRASWRRRER